MTSAPGFRDWSAVATSDSGQYVVAAINHGDVYKSTDYGVTWTPMGAPHQEWYAIATTSDGHKVTVAANRESIHSAQSYSLTSGVLHSYSCCFTSWSYAIPPPYTDSASSPSPVPLISGLSLGLGLGILVCGCLGAFFVYKKDRLLPYKKRNSVNILVNPESHWGLLSPRKQTKYCFHFPLEEILYS